MYFFFPVVSRCAVLDRRGKLKDYSSAESNDGGALVSTWGTRQRRHAEDGSLTS